MKFKRILAISCLMLVTGCSEQRYIVNNKVDPVTMTEAKPVFNETRSFFVYGPFQTDEIDAATICHGTDKILKVESKKTFGNWLLGLLTVGIYTPRNAKIYCSR